MFFKSKIRKMCNHKTQQLVPREMILALLLGTATQQSLTPAMLVNETRYRGAHGA